MTASNRNACKAFFQILLCCFGDSACDYGLRGHAAGEVGQRVALLPGQCDEFA